MRRAPRSIAMKVSKKPVSSRTEASAVLVQLIVQQPESRRTRSISPRVLRSVSSTSTRGVLRVASQSDLASRPHTCC